MQLLSMNFLLMERCGMSIGVDRATDAVLLLERLPVEAVTAEAIGDRVAQFADQVRKLIDWLRVRDQSRQSGEAETPVAEPFMPAFGQIV